MLKISNKLKNLAITILIGGKSTRFGIDKGLFEFRGKPLISYQLEILTQIQYNIFLVAHSKQQAQSYIDKINFKQIMGFIIDDNSLLSDSNMNTPMKGLYSAFKELKDIGYEKSFSLSCDLPLINLDVIEFMINQSVGYDCSIPRWNNGFLEPLFAIYPIKKAYISIEENLKNRKYKLTNIIDKNWKINFISIEKSIKKLDPNLLTFLNINTPEDIKLLTKKKKKL
ncbi:MAG: molybdenum cofactor guanylyltransferase [Candidatus Hodarchaeota archaeon]